MAQNYVSALANGTYGGRCAQFDAHARAVLIASAGPHLTCPRLLSKCLPAKFKALATDQSQLLYATADVQQEGERTQVSLSGAAIGKATEQVTLRRERSRWRLTSPGDVVTRPRSLENWRECLDRLGWGRIMTAGGSVALRSRKARRGEPT